MKDVNIFIPEPGNRRAILAVSALARAMKDMNKVAILRCVWRQGQGNVVVGVLTPNVSDNDNIVSLKSQYPFSDCLKYLFVSWFPINSEWLIVFMGSLIHFTSMYSLLLRMLGSFNSHLSVTSQNRGNQVNNSKRLQMTLSRCLTLHHLAKRRLCCLA